LIISESMTTRNNLTTMLHNLGFDDVQSIAQLSSYNIKQALHHPPSVIIVDGQTHLKNTMAPILTAFQHLTPQRIPVILLLTSRELKQEYLNALHPFISSVIFKPVSPRLLYHQLQRFLCK